MTATVTERPRTEPGTPTVQPGTRVPRSLTVPGIVSPAVASWLAVLLSSLSVGPLFDDSGWFGATLLVVTAVVLVGSLATWLRVPMVLVPVLSAVALFSALVLRFVDDAPLGFVPSPDALSQLREVLAQGTGDVARFAPPVPYTEGFAAITALGVGCVALVVLVLQLVLRLPALAGLPLVAMYVVPAAVLDDGAPWWAFVLVVASWLLLLVTDERLALVGWGRVLKRSDRLGGARGVAGLSASAFRLGAVAVAFALVLPVVIPGLADAVLGRKITSDGTGSGTGSANDPVSVGVDPLVSLRRDLLQQPEVQVLRYTTDSEQPGYLRAVVLEDFDGTQWKPRGFATDGSQPASDGPLSQDLDGSVAATPTRYRLVSVKLVSPYLPVPAHATSVAIPGDWYVDRRTGTVFSDGGETQRDQTWDVDAVVAAPTAAQLRRSPARSGAELAAIASSVPVPELLAQAARDVTAGTSTPYDAALAIQSWLRDTFTYSTDIVSTNPSSSSYLEQFLRDRKGYCEQFSATMALMARSLGIDSRVVVGFTPGDKASDGSWAVSAKNAHAWPELYFVGVGWVPFEPTPRTAADGAATVPPPYADGSDTGVSPSPSPSTSASAGGNPRDRDVVTDVDPEISAIDLPAAATSADTWRLRAFLALVVALVVGALVPAVIRLRRRRSRLRAGAGAEAAWAELRDSVRDLGLPWSDARTPRQAVAALVSDARLGGETAAAAERLGRTVERSRYAPVAPDDSLAAGDVAQVRSTLLHAADRGTRLRALLAPSSLRGRSRGDLPRVLPA